jgi:hypothetical protein
MLYYIVLYNHFIIINEGFKLRSSLLYNFLTFLLPFLSTLILFSFSQVKEFHTYISIKQLANLNVSRYYYVRFNKGEEKKSSTER